MPKGLRKLVGDSDWSRILDTRRDRAVVTQDTDSPGDFSLKEMTLQETLRNFADYPGWKTRVTGYLRANKLERFLDPTIPRPDINGDREAGRVWADKSRRIRDWLEASMSTELARTVLALGDCIYADEFMYAAEQAFADVGWGSFQKLLESLLEINRDYYRSNAQFLRALLQKYSVVQSLCPDAVSPQVVTTLMIKGLRSTAPRYSEALITHLNQFQLGGFKIPTTHEQIVELLNKSIKNLAKHDD